MAHPNEAILRESVNFVYNFLTGNRSPNTGKWMYSKTEDGNGWRGGVMQVYSSRVALQQLWMINPARVNKVEVELMDEIRRISGKTCDFVSTESGGCSLKHIPTIHLAAIAGRIEQIDEGLSKANETTEIICREIIDFANEIPVPCVIFGAGENIVGDFEEIALDGISVKKSTGHFFDLINGTYNTNFSNSGRRIWEYMYEVHSLIKYSLDSNIDGSEKQNEISGMLDRLQTCMCLYGDNAIEFNQRCVMAKKYFPYPFSISTKYGSGLLRDFRISDGNIQQMVEVFNKKARSTFNDVFFACRRLHYAGSRINPIDAITDAVIGMESILLAGEKEDKDGIGYKFAINYSTFFNGREDRLSAFNRAKYLYTARSNIVHGSPAIKKSLLEKINVNDPTENGASVIAIASLRDLLIKLIDQPYFEIKDNAEWAKRVIG